MANTHRPSRMTCFRPPRLKMMAGAKAVTTTRTTWSTTRTTMTTMMTMMIINVMMIGNMKTMRTELLVEIKAVVRECQSWYPSRHPVVRSDPAEQPLPPRRRRCPTMGPCRHRHHLMDTFRQRFLPMDPCQRQLHRQQGHLPHRHRRRPRRDHRRRHPALIPRRLLLRRRSPTRHHHPPLRRRQHRHRRRRHQHRRLPSQRNQP